MAVESEKPEIDYIRYLRNNLLDSYKYGDGFTVFKELIQNASDAEADTLKVYVLDSLKNAKCTEALRTPAIVVYDHGKFTKDNKAGILKIASDNKTSESTKIGRYGLGMKSIFHICDFFIYAANTKEFKYERVFPVNYWPFEDTRFSSFSDDDINLILDNLPKDVDIRKQEGFLLYIPFKISKDGWENVISGKIKPYPFGSFESLTRRIPISLALLSEVAPQEKRLKYISYKQNENLIEVSVDNKLWFKDIIIETNKRKSKIQFIAYKPEISKDIFEKIVSLKNSEYWTKEQKDNLKPELCFELLREEKEDKENKGKLIIHFCVYLPLEEEYCSKIFEIESKYNYTILIHSNFAVDSGRRGIRGFGDLLDEANIAGIDSEEGIQKLWNKYLAQMVLFPNLPLFLNETKKLIKEHNDFCEISNKLYSTVFTYNDKNIKLCNSFTTKKYGFANLYGTEWSSFELDEEKSNYIFLPYNKDNKEIQTLFPNVKDKRFKFILKTPEQKFILPEQYNPDKKYLEEVIQDIPVNSLLEEKYIVAFMQFIDYQKDIIKESHELARVLINHIKLLLSQLTFDDLSKNQTRLSRLFEIINEATGEYPYKIYSIGQKDKNELQKNYTLDDFKTFWTKESDFVFIPGFIKLEHTLFPNLLENVFKGNNTICDFISNKDNCRVQLQYNIISSIFGGDKECTPYIKYIAEKYPTLQIFRVRNATQNDITETLNLRLLNDLIKEKKIFMTQSNPSNKKTVFYYYVKTINPIDIYHINRDIRIAAGFSETEIPSSDDAKNIFDSFSKLYYDSIKKTSDNDYEITLDLKDEVWEKLLDEGFKETYQIDEHEKQFYRFLFSGFDKKLREEPLETFDKDVPDVWKEVFKNIAPDAKKIPSNIPARAKDQIERNKEILNIEAEPLNKDKCRDKLRLFALNNQEKLVFFKSEYFQKLKTQKQLFENFTLNEKDLYKAMPIHINTKTGELTDATGRAFLNLDEIDFPSECNIQIKLIKTSDDPDLFYKQKQFLDTLTIKEAVKEALATKKIESNISQWVFDKMRVSGTRWKDLFESQEGIQLYHWIPLKNGFSKKYCDIQDILNDNIFTSDTREWISKHYEMYKLSDLDISDTNILKEKKLIAETVSEEMEYIGRKVNKTLSFKLSYTDSQKLFSDFLILKDFEEEPIFGLIDILRQERKDKAQDVFEFYINRRVLGQEKSTSTIYEGLINYICDKQDVTIQTLALYETILKLLLREPNFDITSIKYPTQNNEWKDAKDISKSNSSSISKEYLLNETIYELLSDNGKITEDNYIDAQEADNTEIELKDSSDINEIKTIFSQWEASLEKKKLLYLFFYLLKENYKKLAEQKLKEKELLPLTKDLLYIPVKDFGEYSRWWNAGYTKEEAIIDDDPPRGIFRVRIHIPKGKQTKIHSLVNTMLTINIVDGNEIYTGEPGYDYLNNQLHIYLINTNGRVKNLDDKIEKLIWLVWKRGYRQESEAEFNKMLNNFKESNQNTIKTAQLFMFENLILHLKDLNLNNPFFKEIFKDYTNLLNEKTRKDNAKESFFDYVQKKDNISKRLINFITSNDIEAEYFVEEIYDCVVKKINQAKYDQSRILFELLQNADDAVKDLAENGENIKDRTTFEVTDHYDEQNNYSAIHISHFGRLINEILNKSKEDIYSNDLLNMLLINSSEKDEKSTGKFGLGFKSVYFICQEPIIRSGDLQFRILGALYPENEAPESLRPNETRIELRFNSKADPDLIFNDFERNADLQVLFCKYVNELIIHNVHYKPELVEDRGKSKNEEKPIIGLYRDKNKQYLRFVLRTGDLIFKVSKDFDSVESFGDSSVSRVWNLTPLATAKTLPFAINSNFEVDVGRKNLDEQNIRNEQLLENLSKEFSKVLCDIIEKKDDIFYKYVPSILNLILNGCGIKDSDILIGFCKDVLNAIFIKEKIIPDGIGGIVNNPVTPYYIAPNRFNLEYDTNNFNNFLIRLQSIINNEKVVTRNVADALTGSSIEFNEIVGPEMILRLVSGGTKIPNDAAEEFTKFVDLLPYGLPTNFNWDEFKVRDEDGDWDNIRNVLLTLSFADEYSDETISFFRRHITIGNYKDNSHNNIEPSTENSVFLSSGIDLYRCSIIDVYNKWKSLTEQEWENEKKDYYNKLFPTSLSNEDDRKNELNISDDFFDTYDSLHPKMPKSWCVLFMLGNLQSINYWGEVKTEKARKNKIESLIYLIESFSNGNTLDSVYDEYLETHNTDESDLREFESLLRVYKFRKQYMDVWSVFNGLKYSENVNMNMLINPSTDSAAEGKNLTFYSSQKSLKYGISLIIRELLDSGFFSKNEHEQEKVFDLLNKFTYIPHAYLRRIVFNDWTDHPKERTSEDIHDEIIEVLEKEGLDENEIRAFMKCHDLPFLIFGEKK